MRARIAARPRSYATATVVLIAAGLFVWPWSVTVYVPALIEARGLERVYSPRAARIKAVAITQGETLPPGALLIKLEAPQLDREEDLIRARIEATQLRLARRTADAQDLADNLVLNEEFAALNARLSTLDAERKQLEIRAPRGGVLVELSADLHEGRWLAAKAPLAVIGHTGQAVLNGYLAGEDLWRVKTGAKGRFFPDDPERESSAATLTEIAVAGATDLEIAELASLNGGGVRAERDSQQRLVPLNAEYRVELDVAGGNEAPDHAIRGFVRLEGLPESFMARAWRQVLKVLVREAGA